MTIVNHSATQYGRLITASGDEIDIGLELIGGRTLRMTAHGDELGAWPVEECLISAEPDDAGVHVVTVDGDDAEFTPDDADGFVAFIAEVDGRESPAPVTYDDDDAAEDASDVSTFLFGSSGGGGRGGDTVVSTEIDELDSEGAASTQAFTEVPAEDIEDEETVEGSVDVDAEPIVDEVRDDEAYDEEDDDPSAADGVLVVDDGVLVLDDDVVVADDDVELEVVGDDVPVDDTESEDEPVVDNEFVAGASDTEVVDDEAEVDDDVPDPVVAMSDDELDLALDIDEAEADSTEVDEIEAAETVAAVQPPTTDSPDEVDAAGEADGQDEPEEPEGEELRGRFGGSSLERLSSAIGALKESRADEAEEGEEVEVFELEPNTVAADVLESQRTLRVASKVAFFTPKRMRAGAIAFGVVVVIAGLAALIPIVWNVITGFEGEAPAPSTIVLTEEPTVTTTTVPTTTTLDGTATTVAPVPAGLSVFDLPATEFVERWNTAATPIDRALAFDAFLPEGAFQEEFTAYLRMVGEVEEDGTFGPLELVIDPNGPTDYDRLGIQGLGVAIATVDPGRSPEGRATLLASLGLNVRQPNLGGIDGVVESNGLVYTLVYDPGTTLLTLTVAPAA